VSSVVSPQIEFDPLVSRFRSAEPFHHIVIDDFFEPAIAQGLAEEFPRFTSNIWAEYDNPIEIKKASNRWDSFPRLTYSVFSYLNSPAFVAKMSALIGEPLVADPGLHGGGWHTHRPGGKLNPHLDYSIHPKLGLERRVNLIAYLQPNWDPEWGGALGFWASGENETTPGELKQQIPCLFNRAVIFDTSQNSWHGLPEPVRSPEGICRNSIAVYYLSQPRLHASERGRALFAPYGDQAEDESVLELIRLRSQVNTSGSVYRTNK
jgi:Rps23 Pro-64 3,4-dihydroxylase Tpa1-like proline 4-hydroxylase